MSEIAIEVKDVKVAYRSMKSFSLKKSFGKIRQRRDYYEALKGVSFTVPKGRIVGIIGKNGSGKSTLLRTIAGVFSPDEGTVEGLDPSRLSAVFQEDRLCENLSAMANIRLACLSKDKKVIADQMDQIGLAGCANQPVRELSGGMRRRIALLRAINAPGDVLILDEPFKGLDDKTKENVILFVDRSCKGRTLLCVTHDEDEVGALNAKQVIRMR